MPGRSELMVSEYWAKTVALNTSTRKKSKEMRIGRGLGANMLILTGMTKRGSYCNGNSFVCVTYATSLCCLSIEPCDSPIKIESLNDTW